MNTYEITFRRENGTEGADRFVAETEAEARKDFKEVYRHSSATILDTRLVAENTPATKDQEREALEKIKAILDTLGPDSYVGTAFEGCIEDAEENIENDWACSMKGRVDDLDQENTKLRAKVKILEDKLAESEKDYEAAHEAAHLVADEKDAEIASLKAQVSSLTETGRWNAERCDEVRSEAWDLQKRAEKAEAEVIRLKAKLYDYMTAGA